MLVRALLVCVRGVHVLNMSSNACSNFKIKKKRKKSIPKTKMKKKMKKDHEGLKIGLF